MQQELIDQIKDRADVSDDTAKAAAEATIGFLKDKLPDAVAPMLDNVAKGKPLSESLDDSIGGKLGSLLGD